MIVAAAADAAAGGEAAHIKRAEPNQFPPSLFISRIDRLLGFTARPTPARHFLSPAHFFALSSFFFVCLFFPRLTSDNVGAAPAEQGSRKWS